MATPRWFDPLEEHSPRLEEFWQRPTSPSWPRFWWLNGLLFLLTLCTTTVFGSALAASFSDGRPLDPQDVAEGYIRFAHRDPEVLHGLIFSVPLLTILLAHELGHYLVCLRRHVDASIPYFLPSPTLLGTLGAFIRIRSPIYTRRDLFDTGIAGPIAGFAALTPFLALGVWFSRVVPADLTERSLLVAAPLAVRFFEWIRFGNVGHQHVLLHPMAVAALGGLLTTALNLLPMGQLDGGHIIYALCGANRHRLISTGVIGLLVAAGFAYWPWWAWAVVMFLLGRRHPLVYDEEPLTNDRLLYAAFALVIFILSVSLAPTHL